jgi:hypothetical protein
MYFAKKVPEAIKARTEENYYTYNMGLADAFEEAVKDLAKKGTALWKAWYYNDFREYIPFAYEAEYLDFNKYPLAYKGK